MLTMHSHEVLLLSSFSKYYNWSKITEDQYFAQTYAASKLVVMLGFGPKSQTVELVILVEKLCDKWTEGKKLYILTKSEVFH